MSQHPCVLSFSLEVLPWFHHQWRRRKSRPSAGRWALATWWPQILRCLDGCRYIPWDFWWPFYFHLHFSYLSSRGPLQGQESSAAQGTRLKREHKTSLSGRLGWLYKTSCSYLKPHTIASYQWPFDLLDLGLVTSRAALNNSLAWSTMRPLPASYRLPAQDALWTFVERFNHVWTCLNMFESTCLSRQPHCPFLALFASFFYIVSRRWQKSLRQKPASCSSNSCIVRKSWNLGDSSLWHVSVVGSWGLPMNYRHCSPVIHKLKMRHQTLLIDGSKHFYLSSSLEVHNDRQDHFRMCQTGWCHWAATYDV